jgi:hypothetical protein
LLSVKDVRATLTAKGVSTTYNKFDDPDVIRLGTAPAFSLGYDYPTHDDGSPVDELIPIYHVAEFRFNSFPSHETDYVFEIIDENDTVALSESGTIYLVDPPPFVQP